MRAVGVLDVVAGFRGVVDVVVIVVEMEAVVMLYV